MFYSPVTLGSVFMVAVCGTQHAGRVSLDYSLKKYVTLFKCHL